MWYFSPDTVLGGSLIVRVLLRADSFWLPIDLRMEGRIHVEPEGRGYQPNYGAAGCQANELSDQPGRA